MSAVVAPLVEAGEHVVMVLHSAGDFVGATAIAELSRKQRAPRGEKGSMPHPFFCSLPPGPLVNFISRRLY